MLVQRVERLLALAHAGRVADGGELVGALGDEGGLLVGHVVVHRGEVEQDVREHADEGPRGLGAALRVALGQVPVEHRGQEDLALADGAGQRPEHPGRLGLVARVQGVGHVHMALRDAARLAPQAQRAAGHELVELLGQAIAAEAVKGVGVGGVDLMKLLRGARPGGRHGFCLLYLFSIVSIIASSAPGGKRHCASRRCFGFERTWTGVFHSVKSQGVPFCQPVLTSGERPLIML